jgi:hypothetical protein
MAEIVTACGFALAFFFVVLWAEEVAGVKRT